MFSLMGHKQNSGATDKVGTLELGGTLGARPRVKEGASAL